MKHIGAMEKAADDIGFLVEDLQEANNESSDLEHMILLDMIEATRKLQDKIILLRNAVRIF